MLAAPAAGLGAKPQSLSHVAAATLPLAALTAWQALADHAALQPGEAPRPGKTVLVVR